MYEITSTPQEEPQSGRKFFKVIVLSSFFSKLRSKHNAIFDGNTLLLFWHYQL